MGKIHVIPTSIKDLYIIEPQVFGDSRGYFMESYSKQDFKATGLHMQFVQDNESRSKKGYSVVFISRPSIHKANL